MTIKAIAPAEARRAIEAGALLVDIREADEHAREKIPGAMNVPLSRIGEVAALGRPLVFHCRSGMRTAANADALHAAAGGAPCKAGRGNEWLDECRNLFPFGRRETGSISHVIQ